MDRSLPFVKLAYWSDDGKGELTLFLFHQPAGIEISVRPDWQSQVSNSARAYLGELMEDWRDTPPEETSLLMQELAELSTGPLRCVDSGEVAMEERAAMLRTAGASFID